MTGGKHLAVAFWPFAVSANADPQVDAVAMACDAQDCIGEATSLCLTLGAECRMQMTAARLFHLRHYKEVPR